MSLQPLMNKLANYNLWANEAFVNWLQQKSEEELNTVFPSSFSSMLLTLEHIAAVQNFWLSVISGKAFQTASNEDWGKTRSLEPLAVFDALLQSSQQLVAYIEQLSDEQLQKEITLHTEWFSSEEPCYNFIQHCFNHSTYHRGQVVTIGRNVGITDAPMTDYNAYLVSLQVVW